MSYVALTDEEVKALDAGKCPDCKSTELLAGPRGGMNVNIKCSDCGARFNVIPGISGSFGKERI